MQNVSMQLVDSLQQRDDTEVDTIIMRTSWKFIRLKSFFFLFSLVWRIPAKVKKTKPDIVLFSSMVTASILPLLIRKPKVPYVTINHGQDVTFPSAWYQWYITYVFKQLVGVISVSSATRNACIERGMEPEKGVTLPNGFDMKVMDNLPEKGEARKLIENQFNLNLSEKKLLLSVGRQVKRKGYRWFVDEVFDEIKSDAVYLVVGDGPERENIQEAKKQSDKKEKIVILGKQPNKILNACYAAADLFIMPNIPVEGDMEGFGIVLLEANRAGVPAIASDLEGIKDVIEEGVNGYKIPHGKPYLFAQKIDYVLQNELVELSKKSKDYVQKHFSWDTVVDQYISFLKQAANRVSS
ncbi:MAG: glycosyltransferase family 4 protein [Balneolaceae bacterium]|nr:glycosyltransferase family 4 protein [Balneolaceae bacterium]